jgi:hypothetical protein
MVDGSRAERPHVLARHADDDPRWSVFDASNGSASLSLRHDPYGVSVLTDGFVMALVREGETYRLIGSDGRQHDIDGAWPAALGPPLLFGDTLVWPERRAQDMVVRAMTLSRDGPSRPVDAATFSGWQPSSVALSACLLEDGLALMATEGERAAIAFRHGERWSVASAHIGIDASQSGMTCERRGVALSSIEENDASPPGDASRQRYRIQRQRCTPAGCSGDEASADIARISRASRYLLGSIGERVALIWQSPLADVRSLSARPAELATTAAQSLIDDAELPGFNWDAQVEMLAQGDHALLLVTATHADVRATFGYVLGPGGARALRMVR